MTKRIVNVQTADSDFRTHFDPFCQSLLLTRQNEGILPPPVRYPTPTCEDSTGRWYHNQRDGSIRLSLVGVCYQREGKLMYPTPTAHDAKEINVSPTLQARASRKGSVHLNPRFVEWLMGMPEGWTTVSPYAPLETVKFRRWQDGLFWRCFGGLEE